MHIPVLCSGCMNPPPPPNPALPPPCPVSSNLRPWSVGKNPPFRPLGDSDERRKHYRNATIELCREVIAE